MQRKRPVGATVIAILNFVFGGIAILLVFCGGAAILLMIALVGALPPNEPIKEPLEAYIDSMNQNIPGIVPYLIGSLIASLILAVLMIVSGVGLLKLRKSGRTLAITYAVLALIINSTAGVYDMIVVQPGMMQAQKDMEKKFDQMLARGGQPVNRQNPFEGLMAGTGGPVFSALGLIVSLIYPIAVLIVMFTPQVRQAYSGEPISKPLHDDDYDDFDRERRYDQGYDEER